VLVVERATQPRVRRRCDGKTDARCGPCWVLLACLRAASAPGRNLGADGLPATQRSSRQTEWFNPDGVEPARAPSKGTILAGIRKRGKAEVGLLNNLNLVEHTIGALNGGAHPSGLMMVQVSTDTASMRQLGANFNRELLSSMMS
jgi:hypothetical protein